MAGAGELRDREAGHLTDDVEERRLERRLGLRTADHDRLGQREMLLHLDRIGAQEMRTKMHVERRRVSLGRPGEHRPRRRFAPAGEPPIGRDLEEDAPNPGDVAAPVGVDGPHREVHEVDAEGLDLLPLHCAVH